MNNFLLTLINYVRVYYLGQGYIESVLCTSAVPYSILLNIEDRKIFFGRS